MTTTIEITYWSCSEAYAQDPKMLDSAFKQLLGPDRLKGLNDVFGGIDVEKTTAYAALNWDSVQDHMNFLADKERQVPFAKLFVESQKRDANDYTMKHSVLPANVALRCLRAPLTEVALIKAKEGASFDAVQAIVGEYAAYANKDSTLPVAAVYGPEVGNPEKELLLVIGWRSAEDQKAAQESDEVKAIIQEMVGVGEVDPRTTILQEIVQA